MENTPTTTLFNHITQIVHSSAHLNHLKGIFSEKLLIIVEILIFQFAGFSIPEKNDRRRF
jgi:hypothetical protein